MKIDKKAACPAIHLTVISMFFVDKPVIYRSPEQRQKINLKLDYAVSLTHTYPKYPEKGWTVTAEPNGTLWGENNQKYYPLFWEGTPKHPIAPTDGFVVD
jgi:hypothetical protein